MIPNSANNSISSDKGLTNMDDIYRHFSLSQYKGGGREAQSVASMPRQQPLRNMHEPNKNDAANNAKALGWGRNMSNSTNVSSYDGRVGMAATHAPPINGGLGMPQQPTGNGTSDRGNSMWNSKGVRPWSYSRQNATVGQSDDKKYPCSWPDAVPNIPDADDNDFTKKLVELYHNQILQKKNYTSSYPNSYPPQENQGSQGMQPSQGLPAHQGMQSNQWMQDRAAPETRNGMHDRAAMDSTRRPWHKAGSRNFDSWSQGYQRDNQYVPNQPKNTNTHFNHNSRVDDQEQASGQQCLSSQGLVAPQPLATCQSMSNPHASDCYRESPVSVGSNVWRYGSNKGIGLSNGGWNSVSAKGYGHSNMRDTKMCDSSIRDNKMRENAIGENLADDRLSDDRLLDDHVLREVLTSAGHNNLMNIYTSDTESNKNHTAHGSEVNRGISTDSQSVLGDATLTNSLINEYILQTDTRAQRHDTNHQQVTVQQSSGPQSMGPRSDRDDYLLKNCLSILSGIKHVLENNTSNYNEDLYNHIDHVAALVSQKPHPLRPSASYGESALSTQYDSDIESPTTSRRRINHHTSVATSRAHHNLPTLLSVAQGKDMDSHQGHRDQDHDLYNINKLLDDLAHSNGAESNPTPDARIIPSAPSNIIGDSVPSLDIRGTSDTLIRSGSLEQCHSAPSKSSLDVNGLLWDTRNVSMLMNREQPWGSNDTVDTMNHKCQAPLPQMCREAPSPERPQSLQGPFGASDDTEAYESNADELYAQTRKSLFRDEWNADWSKGILRFLKYIKVAQKIQLCEPVDICKIQEKKIAQSSLGTSGPPECYERVAYDTMMTSLETSQTMGKSETDKNSCDDVIDGETEGDRIDAKTGGFMEERGWSTLRKNKYDVLLESDDEPDYEDINEYLKGDKVFTLKIKKRLKNPFKIAKDSVTTPRAGDKGASRNTHEYWPRYGLRLLLICDNWKQSLLVWTHYDKQIFTDIVPIICDAINKFIRKIHYDVNNVINGHNPYFNYCRHAFNNSNASKKYDYICNAHHYPVNQTIPHELLYPKPDEQE